MSDYAKMYQIQFRYPEIRPRPDLDPSWIKGSTSKGRRGEERGGEGGEGLRTLTMLETD